MCKKGKTTSRTKNVTSKCYIYFVFFHRRSTVILFCMKIGNHTCYTNKNIYKKFRIFNFYLLFVLNLLFIRDHMHPQPNNPPISSPLYDQIIKTMFFFVHDTIEIDISMLTSLWEKGKYSLKLAYIFCSFFFFHTCSSVDSCSNLTSLDHLQRKIWWCQEQLQ